MSRPQSQRQHLIESLESRKLLAAGGLDLSFSGDGKAILTTDLTATDVAVQSDGKTVVVGKVHNAKTGSNHFAVERFKLDGTPDALFGVGGLAVTPMGNENNSSAEAVAITPDGKIVVVGSADVKQGLAQETKANAAIVRYNTDGTLDHTFNGSGKRTLDLSGHGGRTQANDVVIQPDGKIVVIGEKRGTLRLQFFVLRFNVNGSLDALNVQPNGTIVSAGFNASGIKDIDLGDEDSAKAVKLTLTGDLIVAGDIQSGTNQRVGIARLNSIGSLLNSFDGNGKLSFSLPGRTVTAVQDVMLQGSNFVIAGNSIGVNGKNDFFIARFTSTGVLDATFGGLGTGFAVTDLGGNDVVAGITNSASGGFVVSGGSGGFAAVKYTDNGLIDASFGTAGKVRLIGFGGAANIAKGPGRRLTLAGGPSFATARLLDAGANVVSVGALDPDATEGTGDTGSLIVGRTERLPTLTRIFFNMAGTAHFSNSFGSDYQIAGLTVPTTGKDLRPFVDIPANQTFVIVRLAAIDDIAVEGPETAIFSIIPSTIYEIGTPASATIDVADNDQGTTTNLLGVTDAYVRDGSFAGTNFGSATDLQVKTGGAGFNRLSYIKFDISSVSSISSVKLQMFGKLADTQSTNVVTDVFSVADTTWTGPTLTFNNKPPPGATPLSSVTVTDATLRMYQFDVTNYVKQEKALGHNLVAFMLKAPATAASVVSFNSGNAGSNTPKLSVISAPDPVGTFTIASQHNTVRVGQETQIAVTWTVPSGGWRQLSSINLLLRDDQDKDLFALIQWDETKNAFRLFNPSTGKFNKSKPVGSDGVLHNSLIDVLLKTSSVKASGPTSPMVTVTFAFRFNPAAAGHNFTIEASARNDLGSRSALSTGGAFKVKAIS